MTKQRINIVYTVDDNYFYCAYVSAYSLIKNANKDYDYTINFLYDSVSLSEKNLKSLDNLNSEKFEIKLYCLDKFLEKVKDKFVLRDYYTDAIYYRLFIPSILSDLDKVIYLDSDTVVVDDISKMYNIDLKDNIIGGCMCEVCDTFEVFTNYVEQVVGVETNKKFINSGILLINIKEFNKQNILEKFNDLLDKYPFIVAPDQDCLNALCKDKSIIIDKGWNRNPYPLKSEKDNIFIVHYTLTNKPWHYKGVLYEEYFWKYAKETPFYQTLYNIRENYSEEEKQRDIICEQELIKKAQYEIDRPDNYKKKFLDKV